MQDISLHILDLVQNSITAGANLITIDIVDEPVTGILTISIQDNGRGMDKEQLAKVTDPFYTTRTTRKVGLGIPLFKASAEATNGNLIILSHPGEGTLLRAAFYSGHIDCLPLGSMSETMASLILCNPQIDFCYKHCFGSHDFSLDTREIKGQIQEVPIEHPDVISFIIEYVEEGLNELYGGV